MSWGSRVCFADQFLHAVFAEVALACAVGGQEVFVGFGLADGDQVHVLAGFLGALVHLGSHGEQVVLHGMTARHGAALNSWMNRGASNFGLHPCAFRREGASGIGHGSDVRERNGVNQHEDAVGMGGRLRLPPSFGTLRFRQVPEALVVARVGDPKDVPKKVDVDPVGVSGRIAPRPPGERPGFTLEGHGDLTRPVGDVASMLGRRHVACALERCEGFAPAFTRHGDAAHFLVEPEDGEVLFGHHQGQDVRRAWQVGPGLVEPVRRSQAVVAVGEVEHVFASPRCP